MFNSLDFINFGMFRNYYWKQDGRLDGKCFNILNIIYGRNYSGKTTLSRIFRSIEEGELHKDYKDGSFCFSLSDGKEVTQSNLNDIKNDLIVRVYNDDFIKDNLSWLYNSDGTIEPITVLGKGNVEIENRIREIDKELGNEDEKGLLFELKELNKKCQEKDEKYEYKKNNLEQMLREKAREIKNNPSIFEPNYTISNIRSDIENVSDSNILLDEHKEQRKKLINEELKPNISYLKNYNENLHLLYRSVNDLLNREIKQAKPISELLHDPDLQKWVQDGISIHKGKRTTCGFCGNELSNDIWKQLNDHFNEESDELKNEIKKLLERIVNIKNNVKSIVVNLSKNNFYSSFHDKYDELIEKWEKEYKIWKENVEKLEEKLNKKLENLFAQEYVSDFYDNSNVLTAIIEDFNKLISENNKKSETIDEDIKKARKDLLFSEVAEFKKDIKYEEILSEIEVLRNEKEDECLRCDKKQKEVESLYSEKEKLVEQMQDVTIAADQINNYLEKCFGHNNLKLEPVEEESITYFKIKRDNEFAKNLSEGERNLISFCFFMTSLSDYIKTESDKLIIFIDDPISSLDNNHVFFLFSMIDEELITKNNFAQIFISTHNLDFLRYLKSLSIDYRKTEFFLIERRKMKNDTKSFIIEMPYHLKAFATEFQYLFKEMYEVNKEVKGDKRKKLENEYNKFYNLPNNIRKFMECYLYYKYPNSDNPLNNLSKFFEGETPRLVNRVINEYSHLTHIERGWRPFDVEEMEYCVKMIFEKMKEKDIEQFEELEKSIKR